MFKCRDCKATFSGDDAGTHNEYYRIEGQTYREPWAACPECGSIDLEVMEACPICGEASKRGACGSCREDIKTSLNGVMGMADTRNGKEAVLDEIQDFVEGYQI